MISWTGPLGPPTMEQQMQNWSDPRTTTAAQPAVSVGVPRAARDAGLRSYMLSVYNTMASGVLLTGIVALVLAQIGVAQTLVENPILRLAAAFSPLIMLMVVSFRFEKMSTASLHTF